MPVPRTGEQILRDAENLTPMIVDVRDDVERTRAIPAKLIAALKDTDIVRMWMPRSLGGPELSIAEFARVIETLAYADGSVGWCASFAAAYTRFAACFPEPITKRIFDGTILAGNLVPMGVGLKVAGGYRVTGRWAWGSGIGHSDWLFGMVRVHDGAGAVTVDGQPQMRMVFFPKSPEVEVIDTWQVGGMRGTGSLDYAVAELFVPEEHTLAGRDSPAIHRSVLNSLPLDSVFPLVIAATPLGVTMAAFDTFLTLASVKTPISGVTLLRDKPTVQAMVGRMHALLHSAREFYYKTTLDASEWALQEEPLTLDQRAQVRLAVAQIGEVSKVVVRNLYDAAGGSSVYEKCPLERHFRDIHVAAQHVQASPNNFEFAGRVLLGLDPGTSRF